MNGIPCLRRYYMQKRQQACDDGHDGLAISWEYRQINAGGTSLPAGFPGRSVLIVDNWALTYEDLDQIGFEELTTFFCLDPATAEAVLAALPAEYQAPTCAED